MYQYVLFDLDGTLTDSREGICKSVQYALSKLGIEAADLGKLEVFIGPPLKDSFEEFYQFDAKQCETAIRFYRERYSDVGMYENKVYSGMPSLLSMLRQKGFVLAVASSKPEKFVKEILRYFDLIQYFEYVVGSDLEGKRSRKEDVVEEVLRQIECKDSAGRNKAIMVGDRKFDVIGAKQFGLDCIGVQYGFANEGELKEAGAKYVVDTVEQIGEVLLKSRNEA